MRSPCEVTLFTEGKHCILKRTARVASSAVHVSPSPVAWCVTRRARVSSRPPAQLHSGHDTATLLKDSAAPVSRGRTERNSHGSVARDRGGYGAARVARPES